MDNTISLINTVKEIAKNKKLVIWGCGYNGNEVIRILYQNNITVDKYVDSDLNKVGCVYKYGLEIKLPSILQGNDNLYSVVVTPKKNLDICEQLAKYGYQNRISYVCVSDEAIIQYNTSCVLDILWDFKDKFHCKVFTVLMPKLNNILNPSPVELALMNYEHIIEDKSSWLKSNSPHVAQAHITLPYYSDEYIENIFTGFSPVRMNGVVRELDHRSEYVNVVNGMRITTDQPLSYKHQIHYFGPSYFYGFGVEDRYTLPSCVQRLLQKCCPNKYYSINYGVRGLAMSDYIDIINEANILDEDIIICYMPNTLLTREFSVKYNISYMDFTEYFHRPHNRGEVFLMGCI